MGMCGRKTFVSLESRNVAIATATFRIFIFILFYFIEISMDKNALCSSRKSFQNILYMKKNILKVYIIRLRELEKDVDYVRSKGTIYVVLELFKIKG